MGAYDVRLVDEYRWGRFAVFICAAMLLCQPAHSEVGEISEQCDDCHSSDSVSAENDVPNVKFCKIFAFNPIVTKMNKNIISFFILTLQPIFILFNIILNVIYEKSGFTGNIRFTIFNCLFIHFI